MSVMTMGVSLATLSLTSFCLKSEAFGDKPILKRSRFSFGLGLLVIAINCFLHAYYGFRFHAPSTGVALDITCYFALIYFFGQTYIPLLDHSYTTKVRTLRFLVKWIVCSGMMWSAAMFVDGFESMLLQIAGGILFFISVLDVFIGLIRRHQKLSSQLTENSVENVENFSRFLYRSLVLFILMGIVASVVSILHNMELQNYFNYFSLFVFWQLFMSYVNYIGSLKK